MNLVDRVSWLDMACAMHMETLEFGLVRVIGSVALFHPVPETSI